MAMFRKEKEPSEGGCKISKKTGEVFCRRKRGDSEAIIYGKIEEGGFQIGDHNYSGTEGFELFNELESEVRERTKMIKQQSGL